MDATHAAVPAGDPSPDREGTHHDGDDVTVAWRPRGLPNWLLLGLLLWIPVAVAATACLAVTYTIGQQALRTSANDPQVQLAQDAAARLDAGATPGQVATGPAVDLAHSLATATIIVGADGTVLASTAHLDATTPLPPPTALQAADALPTNFDQPDTITWQPRQGARQAAALAAFSGPAGHGTVIVSRSLYLIEQRKDTLAQLSAAGWLATLLPALAAALASARWWTTRPHPRTGMLSASGR